MKYLFFLFLFISSAVSGQSGDGRIDSLKKVLEGNLTDSVRAADLCMVADLYYVIDLDNSEKYYREALSFAEKHDLIRFVVAASNGLGNVTADKGDFEGGVAFYKKALNGAIQMRDTIKAATILSNLGLTYGDRSRYTQAMEYYLKGLHLAEAAKSYKIMGYIFNNMAIIHQQQGRKDKALEINFKALEMRKKSNDTYGLATTLNNIGTLYNEKKKYREALGYFFSALDLAYKSKNEFRIATYMDNIGNAYQGLDLPDSANYYNSRALDLRREIGDRPGVINSSINYATTLIRQKKFAEAKALLDTALAYSKEMGITIREYQTYNAFSEMYEQMGKPGPALDYYKKFTLLKDSLTTAENTSRVAELESGYEVEKKKKENELLKKEGALKDAELDKEQFRKWFLGGVAGLGVILAVVLLMAYRNKRRDNELLTYQKAQIEHQKKEITDSINYAKRIQRSILPPAEEMRKVFPESFILYKPKDIVSGDFYWFQRKPDEFLVAAADCTGHGVPGALMSMVGIEKLEALSPLYTEPSEILVGLNREVKNALRQSASDDSTRDGMDIALIILDLKTKKLQYAGANRPVWIVRKSDPGSGFEVQNNLKPDTRYPELLELKPAKAAIGGLTTREQLFPDTEFALNEGDILYMFTDGYADQFGGNVSSGSGGKKMMTKKFKEFLLSIREFDMQEQQRKLDEHFENWKGNYEQVDDVLVIGIKL